MGHRGLGWATHQTINTSEDEDGKMACGLTLIQEGLLDTGAVETQTAGEGKGDLMVRHGFMLKIETLYSARPPQFYRTHSGL